ncbi:hypothetical protein MLD38_026440 [Melastoma candidum]|uniref:Uncharacterized protein n=1 Tax=Melastoma candidum TaxID=119954 RepID=A0ACB9NYL1_9MYRT|nr:hypothetical protein MLD38_026440 [Melastoma candidum]
MPLPPNLATDDGSPFWMNKGDNAWQLTAATLVGLQSVPGLVILYGSIVKKKWAVNAAFMALYAFAAVLLCLVGWGYRMSFGDSLVPFLVIHLSSGVAGFTAAFWVNNILFFFFQTHCMNHYGHQRLGTIRRSGRGRRRTGKDFPRISSSDASWTRPAMDGMEWVQRRGALCCQHDRIPRNTQHPHLHHQPPHLEAA